MHTVNNYTAAKNQAVELSCAGNSTIPFVREERNNPKGQFRYIIRYVGVPEQHTAFRQKIVLTN